MSEKKQKEIFVVLGMHRSGTSTITRALEVFNINLGDALIGPKAGDNEKGFFEDVDIHVFDRKLEAALGSDWHFLGPVTEEDVNQLCDEGYFEEAVELLNSKTDSFNLFGFKDPRASRLLPFWVKVFEHCNIKVSYVLIIRNPVSVGRSLETRDRLAAERSYLLWLSHIIPCLTWTQEAGRVIVDYDLLLQNPEIQVKRIGETFDLDINEAELEKFLDEFLDTGLRHDFSSIEALKSNPACYPLVAEIYEALFACAQDTENKGNIETGLLKKWVEEAEHIKPFFVLMDKHDLAIAEKIDMNVALEKQLEEAGRQEAQLQSDISGLQNHRDQLVGMLEERKKHLERMIDAFEGKTRHVQNLEYQAKQKDNAINRLNQVIDRSKNVTDRLKTNVAELSGSIKECREEVRVLTRQRAENQRDIEAKSRQLTTYTNLISDYKKQLSDCRKQLAESTRQMARYESELAAMTASISWKITRPLRAVKALFSRSSGNG